MESRLDLQHSIIGCHHMVTRADLVYKAGWGEVMSGEKGSLQVRRD